MVEILIQALSNFPTPLATILLASLPLTELRLAIPIAMTIFSLSPISALFYSLMGNALPFFPLFFGLSWLRQFVKNHIPFFASILEKTVDRAHRRVGKKYDKYGAWALFLFTGLPLPLTGLWTATIAATVLGISFRKSALAIGCGILLSGCIVTTLTFLGIQGSI